jgi:DNA-binding Lrp family transcriptional regulator
MPNNDIKLRICRILQQDFRNSVIKISKELSINRKTAQKYLDKTEKELKIKKYIGISSERLGYTRYGIFIKIRDYSKIPKIIENAKICSCATIAEKIVGDYNLRINVEVKSNEELQDALHLMTKEFYHYISDIIIYLITPKIADINLSATEDLILQEVQGEYSKKLVDIANKLNISSPTVLYHLKQLEIKGIISGYSCVFDYTSLGLHKQLVLIQTTARQEILKRFMKRIDNNHMCGFYKYIASQFQLMFSVYTRSEKEIDTILTSANTAFKENYLNVNILQGIGFTRIRNITETFWEKKHEDTISARKKRE